MFLPITNGARVPMGSDDVEQDATNVDAAQSEICSAEISESAHCAPVSSPDDGGGLGSDYLDSSQDDDFQFVAV